MDQYFEEFKRHLLPIRDDCARDLLDSENKHFCFIVYHEKWMDLIAEFNS